MTDLPCALCGFPTFGDFAVRIPGDPDAVMHTIWCGPVLLGAARIAAPTHKRLGDGAIIRIGVS